MRMGISKQRRKINIIPAFLVIVLAAVFFFIMSRMHTAFDKAAHAYANGIATSAISDAVRETFEEYGGNELSNITKSDGAVMYDTDTTKVNLINSAFTSSLQKYVPLENDTTMYIPLGAVTGIAALSGAGPKIPVKIHPINLVNTDINEIFESCGINQVRHSVSISTEIIMVCSGFMYSAQEVVSVTVPVTDTVIIGDTPMYYGTGSAAVSAELPETAQKAETKR